jgi:L-fucose isomerase-like protein
MKNKLVYIPIGVPTFHMPSAEMFYKESLEMVKKLNPEIICPNGILFSTKEVEMFVKDKNPDGIILQNITFANAAYASTVFRYSQAPVLLWTLREPSIESKRLALNSLTGAFSAAHAHKAVHGGFLKHMIGNPDELHIQKTIQSFTKAIETKNELSHLKLASIGHPPQGFGFGQAIDTEMAKTFGVELLSIEARELMNLARKLDEETVQKIIEEANQKMVGLKSLPNENQMAFYKLYYVYRNYIQANGIKAVASRCWPDFFTEYGTPVCSVLGFLNDQLVAAACEADAYGALSMYIGIVLSKKPTYLGDPVAINQDENTITFWHCGTAACSLARTDTGPLAGVHPNRKIGPTMEFGLIASPKATLFRVNRKPDGTFRFFVAKAEILDKPKQFLGTSLVAKINNDVTKVVAKLLNEGLEPHFVVIYDDVYDSLIILAQMLGLEIITDEVM